MGASGENNLWVRQWGNNDQQKNELIIKKIVKTFHWLILNCGYKRREKCCGILSEKFALKVNKGMQFFMNFIALKYLFRHHTTFPWHYKLLYRLSKWYELIIFRRCHCRREKSFAAFRRLWRAANFWSN